MGLMNTIPDEIKKLFLTNKITICVVGLGRIGLPTAAVFAKAGAHVIGVDIDKAVVEALSRGMCRFIDEPNLPSLIKKMVEEERLHASTDVTFAVSEADAVIICVPTPIDEKKVPDYSNILQACKSIGTTLQKGCLVIIESTVGPGTVENLIVPVLEQASRMKAGLDFEVASCPERADPGKIIENLYKVPRVIGCLSLNTAEVIAAIYRAALGVEMAIVSNPKTANAVKLTENLYRDVNIALVNEFAVLYEKLGIDTIEVIQTCATKYNFMPHYPGAGVGGPCLPSNPYYLIVEGVKVGYIPFMVRTAREINDRMPEHVVTLVTEALNEVGKTVQGSQIAVLGAAYKPNIRDIQLTPIKRVVDRLKSLGAWVRIYDPMYKGEEVFGEKVPENAYYAVDGVDCIVLGTAHNELKQLELDKLARLSHTPSALVDARNMFEPTKVKDAGFAYRGVGRA